MEEITIIDEGMDSIRKRIHILLGVFDFHRENGIFIANDHSSNLLAFPTVRGMVIVDLNGMSACLRQGSHTHKNRHIISMMFPGLCDQNAGIGFRGRRDGWRLA
jgi:hypothetical protein